MVSKGAVLALDLGAQLAFDLGPLLALWPPLALNMGPQLAPGAQLAFDLGPLLAPWAPLALNMGPQLAPGAPRPSPKGLRWLFIYGLPLALAAHWLLIWGLSSRGPRVFQRGIVDY